MKKTGWLIFAIEIGISLVLAVIDYRLTTGFILGTLVSIVLYFRNNSFWNSVLDTRIAGKRTGTSHFTVNYFIMALVLVICAVNRNYFNVIACAVGVLSIKWAIILQSLVSKE